jgi:DNA-binding MarR family transcriptional regulator
MAQHMNKFPHDFVQEYLGLVSQYFPGDTTLNQIRILQHIGLRSANDGGHACNTEICEALEMSAATVTRAVTSFIEAGIISEEADPQDGRRRYVMMNQSYPLQGTLNQKVIALARQYFGASRAVS